MGQTRVLWSLDYGPAMEIVLWQMVCTQQGSLGVRVLGIDSADLVVEMS